VPEETGYVDDEEEAENQQHPQPLMHASVNGSTPPAQVYVSAAPFHHGHHHPGMMALEHHFGQFGLHEHPANDQLANSNHNDSSENNTSSANEGEESDDDPVKLFVGQVRALLHCYGSVMG